MVQARQQGTWAHPITTMLGKGEKALHMDASSNAVDVGTVLIVIPGTANYYYNLYARWIADAFRPMGAKVELCVLSQVPSATYDLCLVSNVCEIEWANHEDDARARILQLRRRCKTLISFNADFVHTHWFLNNLSAARAVGADGICDVGFLRQDCQELRESGLRYNFCFDGLLGSQVSQERLDTREDAIRRSIPWAHVGGRTLKRVEFTERLVTDFSPAGFFYLPAPAPVTEKDSPHLNEELMERVLRCTRYYVWLSKHDGFFMESLRFKMAYLAGCVPIKVVEDTAELPGDFPFPAFVLRESEVVERLRDQDFLEARRAFREEYARRPSLEAGLASLLRDHGHLAPEEGAASASPSRGRALRACA